MSSLRLVFHPDVPRDQQDAALRAAAFKEVLFPIAAGVLVTVLTVITGVLWKPKMAGLLLGLGVVIGLASAFLGVTLVWLPRRVLRKLLSEQQALMIDERHYLLYANLELRILGLDKKHHEGLYRLLHQQFITLQPTEYMHDKRLEEEDWQGAVNIEEAEETVRLFMEGQIDLKKQS